MVTVVIIVIAKEREGKKTHIDVYEKKTTLKNLRLDSIVLLRKRKN